MQFPLTPEIDNESGPLCLVVILQGLAIVASNDY